MSQITAHAGHSHDGSHASDHAPLEAHIAARSRLNLADVTIRDGWGKLLATALFFVGLVACVIVGISAAGSSDPAVAKIAQKHALGSYHMGVLFALGLALGCLGLQMILQQFNAGWGAAVRRQCENIASLFWVVLVLFLPVAILEVFVTNGVLFKWMNESYTRGDPLYAHKAPFLNENFWLVRAAIYFTIWIVLGRWLLALSLKQDQTGDKWITAKQRWISSWGLLLFALSAAFASFDWLMSLDFHFFSTMWGVYFFAGSMVSAVALLIVILTSLRIAGKLGPTFTQEHQHDLGKLLFAFTVFWAYVTLCQYFLIWYSNIPEETGFFIIRQEGFWRNVAIAVCLGHFALPFLFLLIRKNKRSAHMLRIAAVWMLLMHALDIYFIVRPHVELRGMKLGEQPWVDVFGILGPVCLFLGFVVLKVRANPLIPIKDPRLHEVLEHKNYV
jgi:hypothetical protein